MQRHRFDPLSFAFGAIYLLIGLLFLIPATVFDLGPAMTASLRWAWPLVVLGIGAAIVIPSLMSRSDSEDPDSTELTTEKTEEAAAEIDAL